MPEDYGRWHLPDLWQMVADDDHTTLAQQLQRWSDQATLLQTQSEELTRLRDTLASHWPPEKSDAARAFIGQLDQMIEVMGYGHTVSWKLHDGLKRISEALSSARDKLTPLMRDYPERTAADPVAYRSASAWPAMQRRHELDEQGRAVMREADVKVGEVSDVLATNLPALGRYAPRTPLPGESSERVAEAGLTASARRDGAPGSAAAAVRAPVFSPPPPPSPVDQGPVLAGEGPPSIAPGGGEVVPGGGGTAPGTVPTGPGGISGPAGPGGLSAPRPGGALWRDPVTGRSAMRPGGVLGGEEGPVHSTGVAPPERLPGGGLFGGGVIGGGAAPTAPRSSRAGREPAPGRVIGETRHEAMPPPAVGAGGWRDEQYEAYARRRRSPSAQDPEDQWAVAEGVPPVLDAPDEATHHDPGPGVIGLDR